MCEQVHPREYFTELGYLYHVPLLKLVKNLQLLSPASTGKIVSRTQLWTGFCVVIRHADIQGLQLANCLLLVQEVTCASRQGQGGACRLCSCPLRLLAAIHCL